MAQRDLGTLLGTVTDPQGAVIPNAKVTITEDATSLSYEVTTNSDGEFIRPLLKPGIYTVAAEATGFKRGIQKGVELTVGSRVAVPMVLTIGDISQTVEVSTSAPLLQTESTVVGQDITAAQTSELPLGGKRVFAFLARLSPGVLPGESGARDEAGGSFSANGVRSNGQNNFLLNGVDNNVNVIDFLNQSAYVIAPSVEAISEISVMTNGYNAEYGRGAGGVVNVQIKSGTNELHGTLFEFLQNTDLNANTWENNKNGQPRGDFKQNQFGAAVGGPIIKNKLFIFGDYQGTRASANSQSLNLGIGGNMTIPTPQEVSGNFSQLLTGNQVGTDALGRPIYAGEIFDPNTTHTVNGQQVRDPFPGNVIPSTRFDPAAAKVLALFPHPNTNYVTSGGPPINDYFIVTPVTQDADFGDARVDYHISDKDSVFGSLSWENRNQTNGQPLPGALDATYFASQAEQDLGRNGMISWTRVWNPRIISETRVAFTRLVTSRLQADPNTDQFKAFGIGGYNPTTTLNGGLPSTSFNKYYSGFGASDWLPSKEYNNVWDFIENVSVIKGDHALKFGAEYRPIRFPFFQVPSPHGDMNFSTAETAAPIGGAPANNTGDGIASFLLGQVDYGQISTNNFISSQKWAWAFFGQDDWKVNSRLTLNLGLRYEIFSPIGERFGQQSNFDPQNNTLYIPSGKNQNAPLPPSFNPGGSLDFVTVSRGHVNKYLIPTDHVDWSPRIGGAYKARPTTVIRAAYGIFYGGEENQGGYPNRGEAVPFNETVQLPRTSLGSNIYANNPFFPGPQNNGNFGYSSGFPGDVFTLDVPPAFRGITQNFRNPMVQKWNAAVQQELGHNMALELSYVGNHQSHGVEIWDPNECRNNPAASFNCDANRPNPALGGLSFVDSFGYGNYAGLTTKFDKRFSNGFAMTSAYTYGHALADTGTTLTGSTNSGTKIRGDIHLGYSSAAWDIRHNWVTSFNWNLPFGKNQKYLNSSKMLDYVVGGWQMNSILTFHTGQPYTLGTNQCVGTWGNCQPDLVPGKNPQDAPPGGRTPSQWFDTSAVTAPHSYPCTFGGVSTTCGTPGTLGLQSQSNPAVHTVDLSLFKDINLTERFHLQFRAESFNIANSPQFGQPNAQQGNPSFGVVTSTTANSQRHIQFAVRLMF